ncbi:hypothetical protein M2160_000296 [Streptomyces sp. SAI-117]|nr:hypothetical protein [Streptomyces sp. SAI-117]
MLDRHDRRWPRRSAIQEHDKEDGRQHTDEQGTEAADAVAEEEHAFRLPLFTLSDRVPGRRDRRESAPGADAGSTPLLVICAPVRSPSRPRTDCRYRDLVPSMSAANPIGNVSHHTGESAAAAPRSRRLSTETKAAFKSRQGMAVHRDPHRRLHDQPRYRAGVCSFSPAASGGGVQHRSGLEPPTCRRDGSGGRLRQVRGAGWPRAEMPPLLAMQDAACWPVHEARRPTGLLPGPLRSLPRGRMSCVRPRSTGTSLRGGRRRWLPGPAAGRWHPR